MNYVDMFVLVLFAWAIFRGATRGLVMQASTLAALVLGIYGAMKLSGLTARIIANYFTINEELLYLTALAITFLLVFFLISIAGKAIEKILETVQLSLLNKMLGVIFSLCKMALILGIVFAFLDRLDYQVHFLPEGTKENSIFFNPLASLAKEIFPSLEYYDPDAINSKEHFAQYIPL